MSDAEERLALSGIRVVDLTRNLSGPYCTMMLGDMGAEVIKIEHPAGGDELRRLYQFPGKAADSEDYFGMFNRNKRSVTLDLKLDSGKAVLRALLEKSDVFVQNLAPGAADRLGFGWDEVRQLNPKIVYVSISGFGPQDPRRAYDGVAQAASGLLDLTGYPDAAPALCGISVGDMSTALFSAFATVSALMRGRDTGEAVRVDVSMVDSLLALHGGGVALHLATGAESTRRGCEAPHRAPGNIYMTSDRRYVFLVTNNATWPLLCQALDLEALITDPRFRDNQSRVKNRIVLNQTLADQIAQIPLADAVKRLEAANVPHSAVATVAEVLSSEHVKSHEMLLEISGELRDGREPIQVMGIPYKMSHGQPRVRFGPPKLGEANDYVTRDLLGDKLAAKGE